MCDWRDLVVGVLLAIAAGIASYEGARLINPVVLQTPDLWFQSDLPRVYADMTDRWFVHNQTSVHPLFLLATCPPVYGMQRAFGIEAITAVRIIMAVLASLWIVALFIILRIIGCCRLDAIIFCLLGATSASAMFWFVVPDTFGFGSLSILLAITLVALANNETPSQWWYVIVSALTFSFTITNWMAGILATLASHTWRRAVQITVLAFCLVMVLWGVEKLIFPSARFFLENRADTTFALINPPLSTINSFVFHSIVMPAIKIRLNEFVPEQPYMSTQLSMPGSGSIWGVIAVSIWAALLALGIWSWSAVHWHRQLRVVLAAILMGQLALHLLYGDETFLYSLHYTPLLLVLAAISTLTRARVVALTLASGLALVAGINNGLQFGKALELVQQHLSEHVKVLDEMNKRPSDIWPRGVGHVVLAAPGTVDVDKAYHEPGGSLSPGVGSFGLSVWMVDQNGHPIGTSETLSLNEIRQRFQETENQDSPAIVTDTRYYRAIWSVCKPKCWRLHLAAFTTDRPVVMIRSVGPAGGPIYSLDWDGQRLLINDRWSVQIHPLPTAVFLGEERSRDWLSERSTTTHSIHESGWAYARIELDQTGQKNEEGWDVTIRDTHVTSSPWRPAFQARSSLHVEVPDVRFMASLQAQILHLTMGLVGQETWRGDPISFRSPELRDGAYTIVALARAGQLNTAKDLSHLMAKYDFYGELGAEADAPGLAIWALEEVARYGRDPDYDHWLWPHVQRKLELIKSMLSTDRPIRVLLDGSFPKAGDFPKFAYAWNFDLVAEPVRDGLIIGRALGDWPLLHVNAISYRGLLNGAALADRVSKPEEARLCRTLATTLKQAWEKKFAPLESKSGRTHLNSLWPTGIAASSKEKLHLGLETRWHQLRDQAGGFKESPRRTYFELNEAHQWLWLGNPEYVWRTLEWFWAHQVSPGLFTWEEGGNKVYRTMLSRWEGVRTPQYPHVTPLYWTAAEMILLQLDMLAHLEQDVPEPTVVIGAGIPSSWLGHPMEVRGFLLPSGTLDWIWDGRSMDVTIWGNPIKVRLGPAFPPDARVQVKFR
jgi:hypothetical protein